MRYDHFSMLPERAFRKIGKRLQTLEGGGKGSTPAAPDYTALAASQEKAAQYGYKAATADLDFRKQQYKDAQPRLSQLYDMADRVGQSQLDQMKSATAKSDAQWADYNNTYRPLEMQVANEAKAAGGEADQNDASGKAIQSARLQQGISRAATERNLASMGVNPNSARFAAGLQAADVMGAANAAGMATGARTDAKNRGMSLRAGAAATGRGQVNTSGQMMGLSSASGAGATGAANTGANGNLGWAQYVSGAGANQQQAAANGMSGANAMLSAQTSNYNAQLATSNQDSGIMGLAGTLGGAYISTLSDRRLKENIEYVGTENGIPLYAFDYVDGLGLPDGRFIGVMAQDVLEIDPDAVTTNADGYMSVNYMKLGIEMRAA